MDDLRGYEAIKRLSKTTGYTIPDLLVLARQNDPFFAGSEAGRVKAEWFAELWQRFGFTTGVHLRRVHYQLVVRGNIPKHNGETYENTDSDWSYLNEAGKAARYLGLVSLDAFIDQRNPAPHLQDPGDASEREPQWGGGGPGEWVLPSVHVSWDVRLDIRAPYVYGYNYDMGCQPYIVELWIEKSTMNDVLLPICRELGVNLVPAVGFQSITGVRDLLRRVGRGNRAARVFYISDYDPAGSFMAQAVARQIEYWLPNYAPGADVKLEPLVMTREQVEAYQLPRTPIKPGKGRGDLRVAGFEAKHGQGATELDALEGLYPGELARLVRAAVLPYRDQTLPRRLREAEDEARGAVYDAWDAALAPFTEDIEDLEQQAQAIVDKYRPELERLNALMQAELSQVQDRVEVVRLAVQDAADELEVELPARPEAEVYPPDEDDWLFDAGRDYMDQLAVYKARQAGEDQAAA